MYGKAVHANLLSEMQHPVTSTRARSIPLHSFSSMAVSRFLMEPPHEQRRHTANVVGTLRQLADVTHVIHNTHYVRSVIFLFCTWFDIASVTTLFMKLQVCQPSFTHTFVSTHSSTIPLYTLAPSVHDCIISPYFVCCSTTAAGSLSFLSALRPKKLIARLGVIAYRSTCYRTWASA